MDTAALIDHLSRHGIKPSLQRLAVMEYLMSHHTHPTVEEIHSALVASMPTLSKTTVYSTLRLLVEKGAAQQLTIDERKVNYDGDCCPHAHFLCRKCSKVYDLPMREDCPENFVHLPAGFAIERSALYYRGLCPACREEEKENQ